MACQRNIEDDRMSEPPPPPASVVAPIRGSMSLAERLERLEAELDSALAIGRLDQRAVAHIYRAEAITDRILEVKPTLAWLASKYSAEAWLRQLQALADRIVAQIRRAEPEEGILADLALLRRLTTELRAEFAKPGGGPPPTPLDSLLAASALDTIAARVNEGATGE